LGLFLKDKPKEAKLVEQYLTISQGQIIEENMTNLDSRLEELEGKYTGLRTEHLELLQTVVQMRTSGNGGKELSATDRVLAYLAQTGKPQTVAEIATGTGMKEPSVKQCLTKAYDEDGNGLAQLKNAWAIFKVEPKKEEDASPPV
jgi:hypothetical protein